VAPTRALADHSEPISGDDRRRPWRRGWPVPLCCVCAAVASSRCRPSSWPTRCPAPSERGVAWSLNSSSVAFKLFRAPTLGTACAAVVARATRCSARQQHLAMRLHCQLQVSAGALLQPALRGRRSEGARRQWGVPPAAQPCRLVGPPKPRAQRCDKSAARHVNSC
jgi:hypothetical protein